MFYFYYPRDNLVTKGVEGNYLPKLTSLILLINSSSVNVRLALPNNASGIEKSLCGEQKVTLSSKLVKGCY